MQFIRDTSGLPRVDYRLSIGENPKLERITPENAYDLPYIRLIYRSVPETALSYYIYKLHAVEVVNAINNDN